MLGRAVSDHKHIVFLSMLTGVCVLRAILSAHIRWFYTCRMFTFGNNLERWHGRWVLRETCSSRLMHVFALHSSVFVFMPFVCIAWCELCAAVSLRCMWFQFPHYPISQCCYWLSLPVPFHCQISGKVAMTHFSGYTIFSFSLYIYFRLLYHYNKLF